MAIIYFYHIPKTGGTYVNQYLKNLSIYLKAKYISFYDNSPNVSYLNKKKYINTFMHLDLNKHYIFHHHHGFPGLKFSYIYLKTLRDKLEQNNIKFIMFTILRDPISRINSSINYNKKLSNYEIDKYIISKNNYICKYLLYNKEYNLYPNIINDISNNNEYNLLLKMISIFSFIIDINEIYKLKDIIEKILNIKLLNMPNNKINKTNYIKNINYNQIQIIKKYNLVDINFINIYKK